MPDVTSAEGFAILLRLLPGLAAAWVFHGLTAYRKLEWWEQVVEALVYTGIVTIFLTITEWLAVGFGEHVFALGTWTQDTSVSVGMGYGLMLGFVMSWVANRNFLHERLRKWGFTKGTSYASEWYSAFYKSERCVYLTLRDKRRIHGWPEEYPDRPDEGHFVLTNATWLSMDADTEPVPLTMIERILIPAKLVKLVEFEKTESELLPEPEAAVETEFERDECEVPPNVTTTVTVSSERCEPEVEKTITKLSDITEVQLDGKEIAERPAETKRDEAPRQERARLTGSGADGAGQREKILAPTAASEVTIQQSPTHA